MGADLLITSMAAPWHWGRTPWTYDEDLAREVGHRRIDAFDFDKHPGLIEEVSLQLGLDLDSDPEVDAEALHHPDGDMADAAAEQRVRQGLHDALDELLKPERRDVTSARYGDRNYWLTGGMSFGDDPTEAFRLILALGEIDPFDEPLPSDLAGETKG